ncbi:unnamed protein product [Urochloa humidicola]
MSGSRNVWPEPSGFNSTATSSRQNRRPGTRPQIRRRDSWGDAGGANPAEGGLQTARRASSRVVAVAQAGGQASASLCPRAPRRGVVGPLAPARDERAPTTGCLTPTARWRWPLRCGVTAALWHDVLRRVLQRSSRTAFLYLVLLSPLLLSFQLPFSLCSSIFSSNSMNRCGASVTRFVLSTIRAFGLSALVARSSIPMLECCVLGMSLVSPSLTSSTSSAASLHLPVSNIDLLVIVRVKKMEAVACLLAACYSPSEFIWFLISKSTKTLLPPGYKADVGNDAAWRWVVTHNLKFHCCARKKKQRKKEASEYGQRRADNKKNLGLSPRVR